MVAFKWFVPAVRAQMPLLIFVSVLFLMGAVFGILLVPALSVDQQEDLSRYVGNFMQLAGQGQLEDIQVSFWPAYFAHLKWLLIAWVFGISVIGLPLLLLLDFLKGALLGFTIAYLTAQWSWKGLLLAVISVFPGNVLIVPVFIFSSAAGISLAIGFVRQRIQPVAHQEQGNESKRPKPFLRYSAVFLLMLPVLALATLIEVQLVPRMLKLYADVFV